MSDVVFLNTGSTEALSGINDIRHFLLHWTDDGTVARVEISRGGKGSRRRIARSAPVFGPPIVAKVRTRVDQ